MIETREQGAVSETQLLSAPLLAGGPARTTLSVCCMTSGRRPALLAGVLAALRDVADEIVIAVEEERVDTVYAAVATVADRVLVFPRTAPADRPIGWLFGSCGGTWIFNIDDDEVPSPALVAALPELIQREDITHAWVARRWLYPTRGTYVASRPWGTEFQLRLVLADERFLQFSDVFHRPLVCHGPSAYVDAPLWHLDTTLNPAAARRRKAAAYDRERPGMRFEGVAHNTGLYLPELHPAPELREVPLHDQIAIEAAVTFQVPAGAEPRAVLVPASAADVDDGWPGPPFPASLHRGTLEVVCSDLRLVAGAQHTVDTYVTNGSSRTWRWGHEGRPAIRLAYEWRQEDAVVPEPSALRTPLPADLRPGERCLVPVHVVAPAEPGAYTLRLDLVHDDVRWFGGHVAVAVEVLSPRAVAVIARPERVPDLVSGLRLRPEVEPIVILRDSSDRRLYGDYRAAEGLRGHLLEGTERAKRPGTLARLVWRTPRVLRGRGLSRAGDAVLAARGVTDSLVIDGANWPADAAFLREWWVLVATALFWRLGHRDVAIADAAMPEGRGFRARVVRWTLRRIRTSTGS